MSSSDSESTCSDLTDASEKSDVSSPVIQNLDIIMVTDATVGSGDDETNAVGKTVQMTAKNSSKTDAEGNSTQMTTPHVIIRVARGPIAFSTSENATDVFVDLCLLVGATLSVFELEFLVHPAQVPLLC